jgi:hypothetical protein
MVSDAYYDTEIDSVWKNNPRPNIYEGTIFHGIVIVAVGSMSRID